MKSKLIYYSIILSLFLIVSCTSNSNRKYKNFELQLITNRLSDSIFNRSVHLIPASEYSNIIRFDYNDGWGGYSIVLTITKHENEYILQLIQSEKKMQGLDFFNINEKKMNSFQIGKLLSSIEEFKSFPIYLDSNRTVFDEPYFEFICKDYNEVTYFRGIPVVYSFNVDRSTYLNKNKEKFLSFIGWLLKVGGLVESKKVVSVAGARTKEDSVSYYLFLKHGYITKKMDVYLNNEKLVMNKGSGTYKIHKSDTFDLYNRVKIIETQWDGEVVEY